MSNFQKFRLWIKDSWINWLLDGIRMILVATLSYVILKECQSFNSLNAYWQDYERIYLGSYVAIQIVVTFIFYTLVGKVVEVATYSWIKKNRKEYIFELEKKEEKEIKEFINKIVEFIVQFKLLTEEDFDVFTDITIDQENQKKKWRSTVETIKRLFGVFILVLINVIVYPAFTDWFWLITAILIVLGSLSFFGLLIYAVIVENLHLVNIALKGVAVSGRLARTRKQKNVKKIDKK